MPTNNNSGAAPDTNKKTQASGKTPLWLRFLLPVISIFIFFALLEGGLALFGVTPTVKTEDPFVGFASHSPLFLPVGDSTSEVQMVTAPNKKDFFNVQRFAREKTSSSYRVFTLGGSTTYGRPYDDSTSFSGWLRELLPAADQSKNWEVINAGGISYALSLIHI